MITRAQTLGRAGARRLATSTERMVPATKPLLSIVVPAYNVQDYLAECLESLTAQTYRNLEIIVIDDGATDDTPRIAAAHAARDKRIRVYRQHNQGLSAARNAGARRATGDYLWFVDSDDTVAATAAERMVGTLQATGSDFAVASYRRFNSLGGRKPGSWIREAHAKTRRRATAHDFPQILVNSVAWSKVYRRSFWEAHEFVFPVGVIYEDQPVSARAYALATAIDILPDVIYNWRERDDSSSISQQSHQVSDLSARLASAQASLHELRDNNAADLAIERAVQILANDMPHSLKHLDEADDDFWFVLAAGITEIAEPIELSRWREIPPQHGALERLLIQRDFDRARRYVDARGQEATAYPSRRTADGFALCVPFWDDEEVHYPSEVLALAPRQMRPNLALRRARWIDGGELRVEGWAYLPFVSMDDLDQPATARLVPDGADPHEIPLPIVPIVNPDIDRLAKHEVYDYRGAAFRCTIDIDALGLEQGSAYTLEISLYANGRTYTDAISTAHTWGSIGNLAANTSPGGTTARLRTRSGRPVRLELTAAPVTVTDIAIHPSATSITVASKQDLHAIRVIPRVPLRRRITHRPVTSRARASGPGHYRVLLPHAALDATDVEHWDVRAVDSTGHTVRIAWPNPSGAPIEILADDVAPGLAWAAGRGNHLELRSLARTVHLEAIEQTSNGLRLAGRYFGEHTPDRVIVGDYRRRADYPVTVRAGRRFAAEIPWTTEQWGDHRPWPTGVYDIGLTSAGTRFATGFAESSTEPLPLWFDETAPLAGRIERQPRTKRLVMTIEPTLTAEERGARPLASGIALHRDGRFEVDRRAVLFRTYYGESATGNALAIHQELRRRGSDLALYWAVKDSSVRVPDGGIPVVINSRRWFEILSTAGFLIDNVHQVPYFVKRPGQTFVETLHGYPFKRAGVPYWQSAGYSRRRIDSFLARHQQWDYLLSPAPYATPLLERDFPSDAKTLEIGYPRNDIFLAPERVALRDRVRRVLGISAHTTAILYAPTYRDTLSTDEFRSRMVDFLDIDRFAAGIGDDAVLLVRGHMMNARVAARTGSAGGRVIDVTDYPEITELCLASDAAILDYSSLRFDYALTGRPMVFLVPDLAAYTGDGRGTMLPFEETAPGPLVVDTDGVLDALRDLTRLEADYADARRAFLEQYMPLEDGHAAARLVDAVFGEG